MNKIVLLSTLLLVIFAPTALFAYTFTGTLKLGSRGVEVKELQKILNSDPATQIAKSGPGSPGNETLLFGKATRAAVIKFQNKYKSEILTPSGLIRGTGVVGSSTRRKLSSITGGGAGSSQITTANLQATKPTVLFTRSLFAGMKNDNEVRKLQATLAIDSSIYPEKTISGDYDSFTVAAVKRFQDKYNLATPAQKLTANYGAVGPLTANMLLKIFGDVIPPTPLAVAIPTSLTAVAPAASPQVTTSTGVAAQSQPQSTVTPPAAPSIPPPPPVAVTHMLLLSNSGGGSISSSPSGTACGVNCTAIYNEGTKVVLIATPQGGYTFSGWGGECSGLGSCTVTLSQNKSVNATFTQNVVVAPSPTPAPIPTPTPSPAQKTNSMGINIAAPLDYEEDRLYTNVMRVSRQFVKSADANNSSAGTPPVDSNGWPQSDFSFYVWHGIDRMHGTYNLSFQGKATVSGNPTGPVALTYDESTNTSRGNLVITNTTSSSYLALAFTNTKRTNESGVSTGVTDIKIMRPVTPGSTTSFAESTLWNTPLKSLVSKFSVIRYMDFLATNWNQQKNWTDRALPTVSPFARSLPGNGWQGLGGPWEHVVLFSNETGKDAWINIPVGATDTYIRNVAQLLAFGSDGVNPYSSSQSNPVYPPLNSSLKIYVEYSNEVWNSMFSQSQDICRFASDELVATGGVSPLNWDNVWNKVAYPGAGWRWDMCPRYQVKRSVEISNIFRSVFGDSAMETRIRPVLMSQLVSPGYFLAAQAGMLINYYNNMGGNFVTTPRPPSYYFYGAGGSAYYTPASSVSTLSAFFSDPDFNQSAFMSLLENEARYVVAMGLKRVAYEGGPSLDKTGGTRDSISPSAVNDSRMTTAVVNMHDGWSKAGGDLLMYFTSSSGTYQWAFASDLYNLSTPKVLAIDSLNVRERAATTYGTLVPGVILGRNPGTCLTGSGSGCPPINSWDYFTANGSKVVWASYDFRGATVAPWKVTLGFTSAAATVAVYVDGVFIGTKSTTGGDLSFDVGTMQAGLHSVIVRAMSGTFVLNTVSVATN